MKIMILSGIQSPLIKKFNTLCCDSLNNISKRWHSKYFITIPIFYVNAEPHLGHLYTALLGDAAVRFQKLKNPNVETKFMVGTDEHGMKVSQSAKRAKVDIKEFCDKTSTKYKQLFDFFGIEADDFIRTTEKRHIETVKEFWNKIFSKDLIYKDKYSGWYCISDETYVSELFLNPKSDKSGQRYTLEGKTVHFMEEENYKFKLSKFQNDLLNWLKDDVVYPKLFQRELCQWIEHGEILNDLSVSRPVDRVSWGIPVPGDSSQTIYVWLDALSSYLCTNGYPNSTFKWPPDVQVLGKDILRFHGVFWPAFLMAADLEPPKKIFCHSHWLKDGEKMSKSKGNVVNPFEQSEIYSSEGLRYFLLREGVPHNDGNFSHQKARAYLNAELADTLGNLLMRCTAKALNVNEIFPSCPEDYRTFLCNTGTELIKSLENLPETVATCYEEFKFYKGVDAIIANLHLTNKFFNDQKPWTLKKSPELLNNLFTTLNLTMESLRVCGILLQPIVPKLSTVLLNKLSVAKSKRTYQNIRPYSWEIIENSVPLMQNSVSLFPKIAARE